MMNKKLHIMALVGILLVAAFFRIWQLYDTPGNAQLNPPLPRSIPPALFPDEAMNGSNAHSALAGKWQIFYRENNGREGFFINLQALSVRVFGHTAFALRIMSALFGILTVLAVYLFAKEYTANIYIGLLAGFFTATSFWHVMFSRIGFRAIMAPFFLSMGLWGLYHVYNRLGKSSHARLLGMCVVGGMFFGMGVHSYIAYRVAPIVVLPAFLLFIKAAYKNRDECVLCMPAIFTFCAILVTVPLLIFFVQNPQDFFGRTSQISIFSEAHPAVAFLKNAGKTIQMFYFAGDFNARHNLPGRPALWWPVALFFTLGIIESARKRYAVLFVWFFIMLLPVAFSSEGVPHALRAIIMIPPVMVFSAIGFYALYRWVQVALQKSQVRWPEAATTIYRIQKWVIVLALAILASVGANTFTDYFMRWAIHPDTFDAFGGNLYNIGLFLKDASRDVPKYVVTAEVDSIDVTGRPMALEPILFASETYLPNSPSEKNIFIIPIKDLPRANCARSCMVIPMDSYGQILARTHELFPNLVVDTSHPFLMMNGPKTQ
jgi:hypothetical protein